ncbi:MAG: NAD(P)-dependent oxidoreductase [Pseudolabrys sp.]
MLSRNLTWGRRLTPEEAASVGAERRELDDLLTSSDIVSIHATLSDETRGLIDARRLGLMKPTSYLINTARGPIVDEAACARLSHPAKSPVQAWMFSMKSPCSRAIRSPKYRTLF